MENINELLLKIFKSPEAKIKERLLGGMMNETYIISYKDKDYVLYMPQGNANDVVDRVEEKYILEIASELGISQRNIYFDTNTGIKCNEFIQGKSLNLVNDFDYDKVAVLLKTYHSSKKLAHFYYEPFKKIDNYKHDVENFFTLTEDFNKVFDCLQENRDFLESGEVTLCHNDFQRSNIVRNGNDYYMIDFEFAANNDPIYDIAAFGNNSVQEGFELLNHYFKNPTLTQKKRYYLWRMFISLQWHLVAILKDKNGEGKIHNIDFMQVSNFFLSTAVESFSKFINLK